ncbi:MAG: 2-oxoglutarate oxidoreductase [Candidatus Latescibacterota bacterium]|nr:MAG: 2-oxoglutarate oxidoreductase [Candidatus Latescibacterota bacterium]
MFGLKNQCTLNLDDEYRPLEAYQGAISRWCPGCGDSGILAAVQRLCRDEQLPPEKTVFVSGIGCASRFPHYMKTYGFHGLHGRAIATAQGIKMRRPDLHVFVNTGDGDCCSIGTAHWIHAIRQNMDLTVMLHDNSIYGLTKMQVSPTTPTGYKTNTTPRGAYLKPLNPLATTLGVVNASFVAQVGEWIPELLYDIISKAFHHKGFSFVRILQRCPHFMPDFFEQMVSNPDSVLLLTHENGMQFSDTIGKIYKNHLEHDPLDINRARELAELEERVPMGIFYRNEAIPRYEEIRRPRRATTPEQIKMTLEKTFDKFGITPVTSEVVRSGNGQPAGTGKP